MGVISHPRDFFAGVLFVAFGALAVYLSFGYHLGSAARMGPAYFPRILGGILVLLGLILCARSFKLKGDAITRFAWRPILLILGSVVAWGAVVLHAGLVVAAFILVVVSTLGGREFRWKEVLVASAVLAALTVGLFVVGLGSQIPIWPTFFAPR